MTHRIAAAAVGITLLLAPVVASAATVADMQTQLMYVLGQIAALKAQQSGSPVACAIIASTPSVTAGEPFALIWNSFGAKDPSNDDKVSQWARGGVSTLTVGKPGNYKYEFTFYGVAGGEAKCTAFISVLAAR